MNAPNAETLLQIWEDHHGEHPIRRALALLDAAWPEVGYPVWAHAQVGTRDAWLMRLYERLFGPRLQTVAPCPACGERLESSFSTREVCDAAQALPAPQAALQLCEQGWEIEYRLPHSEDLLRLIDQPLSAGASAELLRSCLLEVRSQGLPVDPEQLPMAIAERLAGEMERQDPNAEIRVALSCPACGHGWSLVFDVVGYLWSELDDWAQRLLVEVHLLACAYGWRERDVLALSPTRRQLYLDMVRA
jgi:hypothetical protein